MKLSFRVKLLASHVGLVLVVGLFAMVALDRWLTADLVRQLDARLEDQARGALEWAEAGRRHPDRIATRIAHIVDAEVTLFEQNGFVLGASTEQARSNVGPEIAEAIAHGVGRDERMHDDTVVHYVAVLGSDGIVLRLAQPLSEIRATVAAMRERILVASMLAASAAIALGVLAARLAARPLLQMTQTATRLAHGEYDIPIPEGDKDEFGVLWRALGSLASQLKARIGELVAESARLKHLMTVRRDFVANVSHELRTPVTSIRGYAETLLDPSLPAATREQFIEIVHRQALRIGALVEQLLALSELEVRGRGDRTPVPVSVLTIAHHVAETVRSHASAKEYEVVIDGLSERHLVLGDADSVERTIQNLVDNAVKYGRPKGRVTIGASHGHTADGRPAVVFFVADDGPGIAEEHLLRLFERFYRVDPGRSREHGGTGLGLAIVKHAVESMDGTITVTSEVGRGTRFEITLPAAPEDPT